jgi:hypothetical protein
MRTKIKRATALLTAVLAGGYVIAGPGTGCSSYVAESALVATDFCFIFDCQNGILGGTIDPCPPTPATAPGVLVQPSGPLFVDCPDE